MAFESPSFYGTFLCSTGIRQYTFVALTSTGAGTAKVVKLIKPTTFGQAIGVLVSSGTTSSTVRRNQTVQWLGVAKVRAGSTAFVAGDLVVATTNGVAGRIAANTKSTGFTMGQCCAPLNSSREGSTGSVNTELIPVLLAPYGGSA